MSLVELVLSVFLPKLLSQNVFALLGCSAWGGDGTAPGFSGPFGGKFECGLPARTARAILARAPLE